MNLSEALLLARGGLPLAEAEQLALAFAQRAMLGRIKRSDLYLRGDEELNSLEAVNALAWLESAVQRRKEGEPLQYIVGSVQFLENEYQVNSSVLIPRPETEGLVLCAQKRIGDCRAGFEIGLGGGVISIELLCRYPSLRMWASEISRDAQELAKQNAKNILENKSDERLTVLTPLSSDEVVEPIEREAIVSDIDFLIMNPPYLKNIPEEVEDAVRKTEPVQALFAPPQDLLWFYRKTAVLATGSRFCPKMLFAEVPHERADEIAELYQNSGRVCDVTLHADLAGRSRVLEVIYG